MSVVIKIYELEVPELSERLVHLLLNASTPLREFTRGHNDQITFGE